MRVFRALLFLLFITSYYTQLSGAPPKINLNANLDFRGFIRSQCEDFRIKEPYSSRSQSRATLPDYKNFTGVDSDAHLYLKVEQRGEKGLLYGLFSNMSVDFIGTNTFSYYIRPKLTGLSLFAGNEFYGVANIGYHLPASITMKTASGASFDNTEYINFEGTTADHMHPPDAFHVTPKLFFESLITGSDYRLLTDLNKESTFYTSKMVFRTIPLAMTYYTPRLFGLQAGVTYIPYYPYPPNNFRNHDGDPSWYYTPRYERIITGAIKYEFVDRDFSVVASIIGETGKSTIKSLVTSQAYHDVMGWGFGVNAKYKSLSFGGSYGSPGKSGRHSTAHRSYGSWWFPAGEKKPADFTDKEEDLDLEVEYFTLNAGVDVTSNLRANISYFESHTENTLREISVGGEYNLELSRGSVRPYASFTYYMPTEYQAPISNEGFLILTGLKLNF